MKNLISLDVRKAWGEMSVLYTNPQAHLNMQSYFEKNIFVFTHVEKTGGSSFVAGLETIFGRDHVYDIRFGLPRPFELPPSKLNDMWLFAGHFWFDTQERPFRKQKRYFVTIRDPIDRFISHFSYVVASGVSHPGYEKFGRLGVADAYRYFQKHNPQQFFNRYTCMFGERTPVVLGRPGKVAPDRRPVTFELARKKIEQYYVLVIPMNRVDDAIRRIAQVFGVELPKLERINTGIDKIENLPEDIRQDLRVRNAEDYKLINYFEAVFDSRLADLPARLTRWEGQGPDHSSLPK